jgi:lipopolysaccharide export LptBFGC system permease protein LptF
MLILTIFLISFMGIGISTAAVSTITDDDSDGDGLTNDREEELGTNATNPDSDGDGLTDGYEVENEMDPMQPVKKLDIYADKESVEREDVRNDKLNTALFTFLLAFAVFALLAGAFTAYFGAGKSRAIGSGLMVIGLLVIIVWIYFGVLSDYPDDTILGVIHWEAAKTMEAFITVLSALIGAVAAIGLFLVAIMKS